MTTSYYDVITGDRLSPIIMPNIFIYREKKIRLSVLSELDLLFSFWALFLDFRPIQYWQYCNILVTPLVSLQDCGFQRFLKQDSSNSKDSLSEYTIQNSNISECSERANGKHSEQNSEQVGPNISESKF